MRIIDRIEEIFLSISILIATLLVLINVILRLMGLGLTWSEELIRYLLIWVTFIGMSVCAKENTHMSIEFIPQLLKGAAYKVLMFIVYVIAIIFSVMLIWYSFKLVDFSAQSNQVSPGLGIPIAIVYFVIPFSGCLVLIRYIQQIILLFSNNRHKPLQQRS